MTIREELAAAKATSRPDPLQREIIRAGIVAQAIDGSLIAEDLRYWYFPMQPMTVAQDKRIELLEAFGLVENLEDRGIRTTDFGEMVLSILDDH